MTEAEAIQILKTDCCYECSHGVLQGASECGKKDCPVAKATNLAIEALEKQNAKKPIVQGLGQRYCPVCKCGGADHQYCARCGQKLDWSEV